MQRHSGGRQAGLARIVAAGDRAKRFYLGGRSGPAIRELVCTGAVGQLAYEAREPGLRTGWITAGKRRELLLKTERGEASARAEGPASPVTTVDA